jgi:hypothetical protein
MDYKKLKNINLLPKVMYKHDYFS